MIEFRSVDSTAFLAVKTRKYFGTKHSKANSFESNHSRRANSFVLKKNDEARLTLRRRTPAGVLRCTLGNLIVLSHHQNAYCTFEGSGVHVHPRMAKVITQAAVDGEGRWCSCCVLRGQICAAKLPSVVCSVLCRALGLVCTATSLYCNCVVYAALGLG